MKEQPHMEPAEEMQVISSFQLDDTKELLFYSHTFRKRRLGAIRIFVDSPKYAGPTAAGFDMVLSQLKQLHDALEPLPEDLDLARVIPPLEVARIPGDTQSSEWVVQVLEPEGTSEQYRLDIRKYVTSERFTGWTRKGLRIDVDFIDEIVDHLPGLIEALEDWEAGRTGLFSKDLQPAGPVYHQQSPQREPSLDSIPEDLKGYF